MFFSRSLRRVSKRSCAPWPLTIRISLWLPVTTIFLLAETASDSVSFGTLIVRHFVFAKHKTKKTKRRPLNILKLNTLRVDQKEGSFCGCLRNRGKYIKRYANTKFLLYLEHEENLVFIAFDEGERILILPWAQAGCQIDLRDFRPRDRLAASTSCATVSDMITKLCFSCAMMYNFALVSMSRTLPTSNSVSSSTLNCVQQTTKSVNRSRQHHH